ncbi:unnamed protein product [Owenia fusiformis]|uniref:prostaglandin-endoperoxide synthase n=1 Tax=Owenia fusiformis TaxID=6347 RepID=A0A8J1XVG2_OWEFU|nr:unnamed protein product [Owenia fusiformis]
MASNSYRNRGILRIVFLFTVICKIGAEYNNPCCSFPCENRGVCLTQGFKEYTCDCANTGYYGDHCEIPTFWLRIKLWLKPGPYTTHYLLTNFQWMWNIINNTSFMRNFIMRSVYLVRNSVIDSPPLFTSGHEYVTWESAANLSYYARTLPPVPRDCPTPMGVKGPKTLPDVELFRKFFVRTKFKPDTINTNVLFAFFAQHFSHMFFKTDLKKGPGFQWGGHGIDVSHIYGPDVASSNKLRTFQDGKLKYQMVNGEMWPPLLKDAPVTMTYPPNVKPEDKLGLGHEFFGMLPGLVVFSAIWLREHNRVCDVMRIEHPEWTDEQLFQTTRLIIIGQTINIVIRDYVQHLSNYNLQLFFNPELLFGYPFQYQNRITVEFNHLYHWHPLMPDDLEINGTKYTAQQYVFNAEMPLKHGMKEMVDSFVKQRAGSVEPNNHPENTIHVALETIKHGRELRMQPFNNYRKRFNLPVYKTFEELTGEKVLATELEQLYGDVDAVEFYVGILLERHVNGGMLGQTVIELGGPNSVKGLMSNPICSPLYWRSSTFGGDVGFNLVKDSTLQKLFCMNMNGCPRIAFSVPLNDDGKTDSMQDEL